MRRRIFLSLIVLNILAVLAYAVFSINAFNQQYRAELADQLRQTCADIALTGMAGDVQIVADALSEHTDRSVLFLSAQGVVLAQAGAQTGGSEAMGADLSNSEEFVQAKREEYGQTAQKNKTGEWLIGVMPVRGSDIFVRVAVPVRGMWQNVRDLWSGPILVLLVLMFSSTMISWRFTRSFTDPIRRMTEAADSIANGQYGRRIVITTGDELERLADSFNKMSEQLSRTVGSLEEQVGKLDAIVAAMPNGVIAVDNSLRVIMRNPVANNLLELEEGYARVRDMEGFPLLAELLNTAKESGGILEDEAPKGERILRVYTAPMLREGKRAGAVALIADVTELRRLEKLRTEFAANVSHELKTPLTSIIGFTETLLAGAMDEPSKAHKFLQIISVEADRLMQLINDILILSEMEHGTMRSAEPLSVDELIGHAYTTMQQQAKAKNIQLSVEQLCGHSIYGNTLWYNQMLSNLVSNAIKYTPEGGKVRIGAHMKGDMVEIYVLDTGIGIEAEHLPRLFERFYRVDRGRSRMMGGTGLGLAIVKHTAQSAGGSVAVESEPGVGSRFSVLLPVWEAE